MLISLHAQSSSSFELGVSGVGGVDLPVAVSSECELAVNWLWSLASHRAQGPVVAARWQETQQELTLSRKTPDCSIKPRWSFVQGPSFEVVRPASLKGKTLFHILILCNSLGELLTISYPWDVSIAGNNTVTEEICVMRGPTEINPLFCNHNYMNCNDIAMTVQNLDSLKLDIPALETGVLTTPRKRY